MVTRRTLPNPVKAPRPVKSPAPSSGRRGVAAPGRASKPGGGGGKGK